MTCHDERKRMVVGSVLLGSPPSLASKRMSIDYLVKPHLVQLELLQQRCLGSRNEDSDKRGSMVLPPRPAK